MLQYIVWAALEAEGMGASLQVSRLNDFLNHALGSSHSTRAQHDYLLDVNWRKY
jgi:predicted oxidoreductase (fatty acid repression mutant protein)